MSRLVTNAIRSTAASSDAMTIDSAGKPSFPNGGVGKILQVMQATSDNQVSTTSTSYVDTPLSQAITPTSTSSKILIRFKISCSTNNATNLISFQIVRGSTAVGNGDEGSLILMRLLQENF